MGRDIDALLRRGTSLNEIKEVTNGLNLNINEVGAWYDFSKCFVQDKNESAIKIFEFYKKNPNIYFTIKKVLITQYFKLYLLFFIR